jgi:pimeloyl-ACP methyl ester carboxylesterase
LCLQHFTGTLDNWDPSVTDALASGREVILFESAGIGRSSGSVPNTVAGMASHGLAFVDGLSIATCDVLGFSLGGMVVQQMALERPSTFRRVMLVGTAPRGGEDIMHLEKPSLAKPLGDPSLQGYAILQKLFFAPSEASQTAGASFIERLMKRSKDREPNSGPAVAQAQMAAFCEWEQASGERFSDLKKIPHPTLVVNGVYDEMIPVSNSYWLSAEASDGMSLIRDKIAQSLTMWTALVSSTIQDGQADGSVAPQLNAGEVARFLINSWEGAVIRMKIAKSRQPLDDFFKAVFPLLEQETIRRRKTSMKKDPRRRAV